MITKCKNKLQKNKKTIKYFKKIKKTKKYLTKSSKKNTIRKTNGKE